MTKKIKREIKKLPNKLMIFVMLFAMVFCYYFVPIANVVALSYGDGENFINMDINNEIGFNIDSVTVNGHQWTNHEDEFHTNNDQYHIVINVSGNETTGDKVPRIQYGGNWREYITPSTQHNGNNHTFVLDINDSEHQGLLGLSLEEEIANQNPGNDEPNNESHFDGRAYVLWSCGTGVCYHYFDNIPSFDDGNSTFYKASDITADNKEGVTFNVKAEYQGWYLADTFTEWQHLYEIATGNAVNWNTIDPEVILGAPNQHIGELETAAISTGVCEKPAEDAPRNEHDEFENCINLYAAEHDHNIWTHKLQPVGEPTDNNAYVSYGDRNFKVVIYNDDFKGITMGDLSQLNYYPAQWTNPFIMRDQFDISGTTKSKPALLDSILLESTVIIKELNYNSFTIASIEALDVPEDAVAISKVNGEFRLVFSSNFYDNVVFKVTDTKGEVSYMQIKRYTIDGWIRFANNHPVLTADFYFDRTKSYNDFDITAKIVYKDGTTRNVDLAAVLGIDDGLGNITQAYEVDEQSFGGKGLKKATFEFALEDDEDRRIAKVYLNAEYKGSTVSNYAGAYVGSGEGVLANIYQEED